jgi:hypothetical protein
MKTLLAIIALALVACETTPKNPEAWMESEIMACLPTAIAFREGLRKYDVWSEVVVAKWTENGKYVGHAYTAYLYPKGQNQLWTYDMWGSYRTRAYTNDPTGVAREGTYARGINASGVTAEYLK